MTEDPFSDTRAPSAAVEARPARGLAPGCGGPASLSSRDARVRDNVDVVMLRHDVTSLRRLGRADRRRWCESGRGGWFRRGRC